MSNRGKTPFPDFSLLDEPENGSTDSVEIVFRLPSGEKVKRRFSKEMQIQ
jgi:hypothetical protein